MILSALIYFEVAVRSLKAAYFPTDVDTFQCLEQDLDIRKRFEEASAMELQAGWHRGDKKSSLELAREAEAQAQREGEVEELLSRPRKMHSDTGNLSAAATGEDTVKAKGGPIRRSTDLQEKLYHGFGSVRQETL